MSGVVYREWGSLSGQVWLTTVWLTMWLTFSWSGFRGGLGVDVTIGCLGRVTNKVRKLEVVKEGCPALLHPTSRYRCTYPCAALR
ncbi:hypothetical protein QBC39DRAFT_339607 [Podospora conica]|nr:hypothetical protein QBC39DRAFT_339607 [Schizothecium conicum]